MQKTKPVSKNFRARWTQADDQCLAETVTAVIAKGGSLGDAYKQAARDMSRSYEGTRTRAQFLRNQHPRRDMTDNGVRLRGNPIEGFTIHTSGKSRGATRPSTRVFTDAWLNATFPTVTLTIDGVTLTGTLQDVERLVLARCRALGQEPRPRG